MGKFAFVVLLLSGFQVHAAALKGDLYCKFPSGDLKGYFYMDWKFNVVQILELPGQALNENPVPVVREADGSMVITMSNMTEASDAGKIAKVTIPDFTDMAHFVAELSVIAADEAGPYPLTKEQGECKAR